MACLQVLSTGLALLVAIVRSHSFIIEARTVVAGTFVGTPGYPRGYGTDLMSSPTVKTWLTVKVTPSTPTFDEQMTYLLPLSQRSRFTNDDLICKSTQIQGNQSSEYPILRAKAGDLIALRYRENGHITKQEDRKSVV